MNCVRIARGICGGDAALIFCAALLIAYFVGSVATAQDQMSSMDSSAGAVMEMKDEIPPEQLPEPQKLTGIGNVHLQVTTTPEAQAWFDQGLDLLHDFWDYESARAFEQAVRVDANCAMCYWGLYRAESYYHSTAPDYAAISLGKAVSLESHASAREQLYIEADAATLAARNARGPADFSKGVVIWRKLVQEYPDDSQARIFLASAVGWGSPEGRQLLEGVMKDDPQNSAANHYYIHGLEATPHPEQALHSAEILASLAPASGHMIHMPGHIYFRLGDYARAEESFDASMRADETYMREQHVSVDDDWNYVHNLMYAVANLMEEGKLKQATEYSAKLTGARGELDSTLYPFSARDSVSRLNPQLPVALRTGDWARVIELAEAGKPLASQPNLRLLAREMVALGIGMRAAESNSAANAAEESAAFDAELWRATQKMNESRPMGQAMDGGAASGAATEGAGAKNARKIPVMSDAYIEQLLSMLSVMSLELRGSMLTAERQTAEAKDTFARAEREEKALGYHEPPLYIRPPGETEGAALLTLNDFADAKAAYQKALAERPRSGYSLYGIALCDEKAGDVATAAKDYSDFLAAWKDADANLPQIAHARAFLAKHPAPASAQQTSGS